MIHENERMEFTGQIIDIFEDFLQEYDAVLSFDETNDALDDEEENEVCIYGTAYDQLAQKLEALIRSWGLVS